MHVKVDPFFIRYLISFLFFLNDFYSLLHFAFFSAFLKEKLFNFLSCRLCVKIIGIFPRIENYAHKNYQIVQYFYAISIRKIHETYYFSHMI